MNAHFKPATCASLSCMWLVAIIAISRWCLSLSACLVALTNTHEGSRGLGFRASMHSSYSSNYTLAAPTQGGVADLGLTKSFGGQHRLRLTGHRSVCCVYVRVRQMLCDG